jgi:glutathione S-transferase
MLIVHARTLDPMSRALRLALGEKRASFHVREVAPFEDDPAFLAIEGSGLTPVLVDDSWGHGATIAEAGAALEYLEDLIPTPPLFPGGPLERAETRALTIRAGRALAPVVAAVVEEKAAKRLSRGGSPDVGALRQASETTRQMLDQVGAAAEARGWIAGPRLSLADLVAAAHFSVLDFLDAVRWEASPSGKDWYARLKQRPCFRPLLSDTLPGVAPPGHYADLDF